MILKGISGFTPVLATYLKKLSDKKESAIYYLTDLTQQEKEKLLILSAAIENLSHG